MPTQIYALPVHRTHVASTKSAKTTSRMRFVSKYCCHSLRFADTLWYGIAQLSVANKATENSLELVQNLRAQVLTVLLICLLGVQLPVCLAPTPGAGEGLDERRACSGYVHLSMGNSMALLPTVKYLHSLNFPIPCTVNDQMQQQNKTLVGLRACARACLCRTHCSWCR